MLRTSIRDTEDKTPDVSSRPKVTRRSVSRARRPTRPVVVAGSSLAKRPVRPHRSEANTIQALMDLALPRFEGLGDGPRQVHRPWMVSTESPASPDARCVTEPLRSPSPCINLDALSSDDSEGSVGLCWVIFQSRYHTPVNSDQVLSDEDLPPVAGSEDSRQVIRIRDVSPDVQLWIFLRSVGLGIPDGQCPRVAQVSGCRYPFVFRPRLRVAGLWMMLRDCGPPIRSRWSGRLISRRCDGWRPSNSLRLRCQGSGSPRTVAFNDLRDSSVPLSPNRVLAG